MVGREITRKALDSIWRIYEMRVASGVRHKGSEFTFGNNDRDSGETPFHADLSATLHADSPDPGPSEGPIAPSEIPSVPWQSVGFRSLRGFEYDRIPGSPTHDTIAIGAILVENGNLSARARFRLDNDDGSVGMTGAEHPPGFELTTGSSDQAITQLRGIAFAEKRRGGTRRSIFMSGEPEEGQTRECIQCVIHYRLYDAVTEFDVNGMQCDSTTADHQSQTAIKTRGPESFATSVRRPHKWILGSPAKFSRRQSIIRGGWCSSWQSGTTREQA